MTTLPETTTASAQALDEGTKGLRSKHLLSIEELSQEDIELILDTAEAMKEIGTRRIKKVPT